MRQAVLIAVMCAALPAQAQDALDTIHLRSGGILRGTLLSYQPGEDATIQTVTGEVQTVSAAEIAEVQIAGRPSSIPVEPAQPEEAPSELESPSSPRTEVPAEPVRAWEEPRDLSDGHGNSVPWYQAPVPVSAAPPGDVHVGVQLAGGVQVLTSPDWISPFHVYMPGFFDGTFRDNGPAAFFSIEAVALLDVWLIDILYLRIEAGAHLGPGSHFGTQPRCGAQPSPASLGPRARVLASLIPDPALALRLGPYGGFEIFGERPCYPGIHNAGSLGGTTQAVVRLTDERRLELGASIDMGLLFLPNGGTGGNLRTSFDLRAQLVVAYLF